MSNRLVRVAPPEPIDYQIGDHTIITFLGDFPGIMQWMTPGPDGRVEWIQPDQVEAFLTAAVDPASAADLTAALTDLGERSLYTMAQTVWKNCQHLGVESAAARMQRLADAIAAVKTNTDDAGEEADADAVPTSA